MLKKFPSNIHVTKNTLIFLSRALTHHSLLLIHNSYMSLGTRFVSLKAYVGIFHFRFRFVFIKV